jgi:hypothetical protein
MRISLRRGCLVEVAKTSVSLVSGFKTWKNVGVLLSEVEAKVSDFQGGMGNNYPCSLNLKSLTFIYTQLTKFQDMLSWLSRKNNE